MVQALTPFARMPALGASPVIELVQFKGDVGVFVAPGKPSLRPVSDPSPALITWLKCAQCGRRIARDADRIEVNDKHEHTFINPAGVIYKIGCFSSAPGVSEVGPASAEFAWFRGHLWRCVCCSDCETHLGWTFTSDAARFVGLILDQLSDAETGD